MFFLFGNKASWLWPRFYMYVDSHLIAASSLPNQAAPNPIVFKRATGGTGRPIWGWTAKSSQRQSRLFPRHQPAITSRCQNMDPGSEKPLQRASKACLNLFESCFLRNSDAFTELEAAERLFRAWTNNLRVFSKDTSLDTRLRAENYDEIRQMIILLLKILDENLSLGM